MRMKSFKPTCNLNTIRDGRGAIFTFVPDAPILEWTHQFIKAGKVRGNHCHPEFDEYILLVDGPAWKEKDVKTGKESFIYMNKANAFISRAKRIMSFWRSPIASRFISHQAMGRLPETHHPSKSGLGEGPCDERARIIGNKTRREACQVADSAWHHACSGVARRRFLPAL